MTDAAQLQAASQAARKKRLGAPAKRTEAECSHLYNTCGEGDYPAAKRLLNEPGWAINRPHGAVAWTLLHYAAYNGHAKIAKLLLVKGARSDLADVKGWTAVDYASRENHHDVVHVLQDEQAIGAVRAAVASRKQQQADAVAKAPEVQAKKKHYLAKPEEEEEAGGGEGSALQAVVALLLKHGADPLKKDLCGQTPLDCARRLKRPAGSAAREEVVELLVRAGAGSQGQPRQEPPARARRDPHGHRAAEAAADAAAGAAVQASEPNEVDLLRAELVAMAASARAAAKATREERFFECAGHGDVGGLQDLLADDLAAATQPTEAFCSAVAGAAEGAAAATVAAVGSALALWGLAGLAKGDVNVNCGLYRAQRSPLHAACFAKHPDAVAFLLLRGADVDKRDYIGRTPLAAALRVRFY